jgi:hypothetical protein
MTDRAEEEVYRGIHYVRVSDLPHDQQFLFTEWLPKDQVIKIMIQKEVFEDCVQYHHYKHWHENVYPTQERVNMGITPEEEEPKSARFNFSFLKTT